MQNVFDRNESSLIMQHAHAFVRNRRNRFSSYAEALREGLKSAYRMQHYSGIYAIDVPFEMFDEIVGKLRDYHINRGSDYLKSIGNGEYSRRAIILVYDRDLIENLKDVVGYSLTELAELNVNPCFNFTEFLSCAAYAIDKFGYTKYGVDREYKIFDAPINELSTFGIVKNMLRGATLEYIQMFEEAQRYAKVARSIKNTWAKVDPMSLRVDNVDALLSTRARNNVIGITRKAGAIVCSRLNHVIH